MSPKNARVIVNGYGVIGKRIADAVAAQDDMELIGVADATPKKVAAANLERYRAAESSQSSKAVRSTT